MVRISFVLVALFLTTVSFGQYSVKEKDILYKRRLIRSITLSDPVNASLFGNNNQLVTILLNAFERGDIQGYKEEDCEQKLSFDDFKKKTEWPEEDTVHYVDYRSLNLIEIGEDLIVDKHRSEIIFDIEVITIFLPEKENPRGILESLVTFKYDDCIKVFKKDKNAVAINPLRNGRNINFSEVLLLKLYQSEIVRIGNSNDPYFDQLTNDPLQAFLLRKKSENELTEMLYKLFNPK